MGLSADSAADLQESTPQRPSILVLGPKDAGKRSVVRRLVRGAKNAQADLPGGVVTSHRWSIDTKYYTADVNLWVSHAEDLSEDPPKAQVLASGCDALVLVFDLSEGGSFARIQDCASSLDLSTFDVLLCIANKADLVPDHHAHATLQHQRPLQWEERHRLVETEDTPVIQALGTAPKSMELRRQEHSEWCLDNGIEYIETCALDEHFDERISADGDMQGIARLRSALHAHMWPGMVMKPKAGVKAPHTLSGEESDISIEYELLGEEISRGLSPEREHNNGNAAAETTEGASEKLSDKASVEDGKSSVAEEAKQERPDGSRRPDENGKGESRPDRSPPGEESLAGGAHSIEGDRHSGNTPGPSSGELTAPEPVSNDDSTGDGSKASSVAQAETRSEDVKSESSLEEATKRSNIDKPSVRGAEKSGGPLVLDEAAAMKDVEHEGDLDFAEMERILGEMSSVRDRLSGLPDSARRDEAARYAMRLMQMFGGDESEDE